MSDIGVNAAARLAALGSVTIEPGLSDDEFTRVEDMLGFEFADDHRAFLSAGLPVGTGWPNWRGGRAVQKQLQLPIDGILFAVEWRDFWPDSWGARPVKMKDALRSANYHLARTPRLVPVYSHRYLPAGRGSSGHPVLSVIQTTVIVAGTDLADYIAGEFGSDGNRPAAAVSTVGFWTELVS
ncbi:hypothetical protein BH11ACT7_BH11ACT7_24060 [soil metagenome]